MIKVLDRIKFYEVVNQWIRDGSELESFGNTGECEWVVLRGKDGAREEIYYFFLQRDYDLAIHFTPYEG